MRRIEPAQDRTRLTGPLVSSYQCSVIGDQQGSGSGFWVSLLITNHDYRLGVTRRPRHSGSSEVGEPEQLAHVRGTVPDQVIVILAW